MTSSHLPSSDLVRQAVIAVAQLPESDLVAVVEFVSHLNQQAQRPTVAEIKAEAERLQTQLHDLPRAELFKRFKDNLDVMRADALARGVAIEGEVM